MVSLNTAIQFLDPTESQATCLKITAMHLYFKDLKTNLDKSIFWRKSVKDFPSFKWHTIVDFGFATLGDFIREIGVFLECDDDIVYQTINIFEQPNWDDMTDDQITGFLKKVELFDKKLLDIRNIIDQCLPKQEFIDPKGKKIGDR